MIIWLASYPKSGNTLLRSILATYFFSKEGEFKFDYLYKIEQFPSISNFENIGVDVLDEKKVFNNFIQAQKFINKEKNKVYELQGKRLGCFCKPELCHGDILANYLNSWDDGK